MTSVRVTIRILANEDHESPQSQFMSVLASTATRVIERTFFFLEYRLFSGVRVAHLRLLVCLCRTRKQFTGQRLSVVVRKYRKRH